MAGNFPTSPQTSGIPFKLVPVSPNDDQDIPQPCIGLRVQADGNFTVRFKADPAVDVVIAGTVGHDLIGEVSRVMMTGTDQAFTDPDPPKGLLAMIARG